MKQKLLLLAAVFFGVLAFMFTWQQIRQEKQKLMSRAQEVELIMVVRDLTAGEKIQEDDIKRIKIPRFTGTVTREIPWGQKDRILDCPVADQIPAKTVLTWSDIKMLRSGSSKSGLTALTRPGFRAVSIPVDAVSSVTGLVQPNNFVDIIGTFSFPDTKNDASYKMLTLTILQRVRVLACGTDLGYTKPQGVQSARSYNTVTLELTPKEVEMIVFAQQQGRLTLSLRPFEDPNITRDLQSVDWSWLRQNLTKYNDEREKEMRKLNR